MEYILDICPTCMDKLYEREQIEDEEKYYAVLSEANCPHCGRRLFRACVGEKKPDDTDYKIVKLPASISRDREEQCIEVLMEIGHCDRKTAIERLNAEKVIICEGKLSEIYFAINKIRETEGGIQYKVEPEFPYSILGDYYDYFCKTCERELVYKEEELADDPSMVKSGFFCENCNEWVVYKWDRKASLDESEVEVKYKQAFTEEELELLKRVNPGLEITLEELNSM